MHSLDKLGHGDSIAKRAPNTANTDLQDSLADSRPRPHRIEQHPFGHQLPRMLKQAMQNGKVFGLQRYSLCPMPKTFVPKVEPKRGETNLHSRRHILLNSILHHHRNITAISLLCHDS
jgi:hypothetical protein